MRVTPDTHPLTNMPSRATLKLQSFCPIYPLMYSLQLPDLHPFQLPDLKLPHPSSLHKKQPTHSFEGENIMLKKRFRLILALVSSIALSGAMVITPAAASSYCPGGHFCAWQHSSYGGNKLLESAYTGWSDVDVADDRTSSGKNRMNSYHWCGVADMWPSDVMVFNFAPRSSFAWLGSANDAIDWFYVRNGYC